MLSLQKAIIVVLGELGVQIEEPLTRLLSARKLSDSQEYPAFLYDIITLGSPFKTNAKTPTKANSKKLTQVSNDGGSITLADLKATEQAFAQRLLSGIRKVTHAQKINLLRVNRGILVKPELYFYILTPVCDDVGRFLFYNIVKTIHRVCRPAFPPFQVQALLLMPDIFAVEETAENPMLPNARAYAFLQEFEQIMNNKVPSPPWGENYPLQRVWLIDAYNQQGNFVGTIDTMKWTIAEVLTSIIVDSVLDLTEGADAGQIQDGYGKRKFYSSFGAMQLLFPKNLLLQQLTNRVLLQALNQMVTPEGASRDEIVVSTRLFVNQRLQTDQLAEKVCYDQEGKALISDFISETSKELDVRSFISELGHEAQAYEMSDLDENKLRLFRRATQLIQEKATIIDSEIDRLINDPEKGIIHSLAFADELLGRGEQSPFLKGDTIEPQKNLLTIKQNFLTRMERLLGLGGEDIRVRVNEIETELIGINMALAKREEELQHLNESPATQPWEKKTVEENINSLKQQLEGLEQTKRNLQKKLELRDQIWDREDIRQEAIRKAIEEKEIAIEEQKKVLLTNQDEINKLYQDLIEIGERSRQLLAHYFIYYPVAIILGIVLAAVVVWWGAGEISGISWWSLYLLLTLLLGLRLLPIMLIVNLVLAARSYRREVTIPRHDKYKRIEDLEHEIDSQKSELREKYKELFQAHLDIYIHERIIRDILPSLLETIEGAYQRAKGFLEDCKNLIQRFSSEVIPYPESLTRMSVISIDDDKFFLGLLFPEGVEGMIDRFLTERGQALSDYVKEGDKGLERLKKEMAEWVSEKSRGILTPVSIEDIIFDHYNQLNTAVPPENRMAPLQTLTPFLQVVTPPGEERVTVMHAIGVEEVDRSRLQKAFTGTTEPVYWSHYDNSMISAFCWTNNFSQSYIGRLSLYQEAYDKLKNQGTKELHHPEFPEGNFIEAHSKRS